MRVGWRSSRPEEVTEIDADGNPVPSSLTVAEDLALRTAALGVCEYCDGPLTEIWSAGCGTTNTTYFNGSDGGTTGFGTVTGAGGSSGPAEHGESWRFCSKEHMDAFLDLRGAAMSETAASGKVFYVLVCRLCGDPDNPLPMPFESPAERGKWAAGHTAATGHDRWFVLDQPAGSSGRAEIPALIREHDQVVAAWRSGYETGERQ